MTRVLQCNLQDYLEIACMFGYRITLRLTDDSEVTGKAIDVFSKQGVEIMLIATDDDQRTEIHTSTFKQMTVLTQGARFQHIDF